MMALIAVAVCLGAPTRIVDRLPEPLREMIAADTSHTSQVDWTVTWVGGRDDGLVEQYITRTAGESIWQSNLGDEQGFHRIAFSQSPPKGSSQEEQRKYEIPREQNAGTRNALMLDGKVWYIYRAEQPISGSEQPVAEASAFVPLNFSAAGFSPHWNPDGNTNVLGLPKHLLSGFESATWSRHADGAMESISAVYDGSRLDWYLDRRQGGRPVRAAFYRGDALVYASETDYTERDGRWFPASIRFYRGNSDQPVQVIDIQDASFDKPWHLQEIGLGDIGALFGTYFTSEHGMRYWSGTELISLDEYNELVYIYGMRPDSRIIEMLARVFGQTVDEYLADMDRASETLRDEYYRKHGEAPWLWVGLGEKDEWDIYVENFIKKHKLDKPRTRRAHEILKRAKKLRDARRGKNIRQIRKGQREGDEEKLARFEAVTKRIFDKMLVKGLKKLVPRDKAPRHK